MTAQNKGLSRILWVVFGLLLLLFIALCLLSLWLGAQYLQGGQLQLPFLASPTPLPPTSTPTSTPRPTPTSTPEPQSGDILFSDDFSAADSGWDIASDEQANFEYTSAGEYLMELHTESLSIWSNPGREFSDVIVEVDVTNQGTESNDFGILCRYVNSTNFYFLIASSDGYFAIGKLAAGDWKLLSGERMLPTTAVKSGAAVNRLRAECIGQSLTLIVNDAVLATVTDKSFDTGDVG